MRQIEFTDRELVWEGDCCYVDHSDHPNCNSDKDPKDFRYRRVRYQGETWAAHRLSYNLNIAPIPVNPPSNKEELVLHTCDNEWCVNPDHLYIGDSAQNRKDALERCERLIETVGRWNKGRKRSLEQRKAQSERMKGNILRLGAKQTEEFKKRMSTQAMGNKSRTGQKQSPEEIEKRRQSILAYHERRRANLT